MVIDIRILILTVYSRRSLTEVWEVTEALELSTSTSEALEEVAEDIRISPSSSAKIVKLLEDPEYSETSKFRTGLLISRINCGVGILNL